MLLFKKALGAAKIRISRAKEKVQSRAGPEGPESGKGAEQSNNSSSSSSLRQPAPHRPKRLPRGTVGAAALAAGLGGLYQGPARPAPQPREWTPEVEATRPWESIPEVEPLRVAAAELEAWLARTRPRSEEIEANKQSRPVSKAAMLMKDHQGDEGQQVKRIRLKPVSKSKLAKVLKAEFGLQ